MIPLKPSIKPAFRPVSVRPYALFAIALVVGLHGAGVASAQEQESEESQDEQAVTRRQEIWLSQREAKQERLAQEPAPYEIPSAESRILSLEKRKFPQNIFVKGFHGIRPLIGGMPTGSGWVGGVGYIRGLEAEYFQMQANARISSLGYQVFDAEVLIPAPAANRRIEWSLRGAYRDLGSLRFFGLGDGTSEENRSTFALEEQTVTTALWINPRGLLSFAGEGGWLQVQSGPGDEDDAVPLIFPNTTVPGLGAPQTWIEFDLREKSTFPAPGVVGRLSVHRFEDTELSLYDFKRVVGDVAAYIPLGYRNRMIALRARTSHSTSDEGNEVPFFLMETLGGAETVRGFDAFRFRDQRNLLLSAEYRWEVWTYTDFTVFFDAGKVFSARSDFDFDDLYTGYGFGIRVHTPSGLTFRIDIAHSTEGPKLHIGAGPSF